jgi:cell shape-determining protein MreC
MKTLLPWIIVIGLSAGLGAMYVTGQRKQTELTKAQTDAQAAQSLRAELDDARSRAKSQEDELVALRKDKEDLLRLRNQVRQLQSENQQLSKDALTARTESQRAQAQATEAAKSGAQQVQQLQNENQQLRTTAVQSLQTVQRNACINNLRQLEGAKQQWALQNSKPVGSVPSPEDLAPYLNNNIPSCPAGGGQYTFNGVGQEATCSIGGHVLPKPAAQ